MLLYIYFFFFEKFNFVNVTAGQIDGIKTYKRVFSQLVILFTVC